MTRTTFPFPFTRRGFLAGGGALFAAGCTGIGPSSGSLQLYVLHAPPAATAEAAKVPWQLAVAVPDAPASLDSERIALNRTPTTMDYFANAAWTDRAPVLIQGLLVETLENNEGFAAVFRDTTALHSDFLLQSEIRDFQARYALAGGPPQIVVRIESKLVKMPDRAITGSFTATETAAARENRLDSIVQAFDAALGAALQKTADWTLRTATPPAEPPAPPAHRRRRKPVP